MLSHSFSTLPLGTDSVVVGSFWQLPISETVVEGEKKETAFKSFNVFEL